jgi:thiol-disulfide isomerase/thioredoxin
MARLIDKKLLAGLVLGAVLAIAVGGALSAMGYMSVRFASSKQAPIKLEAPPVPGTTDADFDWKLTSLTDKALDFASLKGQVIFVTIWSPECPFCVAEMGYIEKLYEEMADEGVVFVCATPEKYAEAALEHAVRTQLSLPLYTYPGELPASYTFRITPATFIIDRNGKIAWSHEGAAKWNDDATVQYLRGLLIPKDS